MAAPEIDEFELMRRRIRGQGGQRADQSQRELQRRFAALGNLDSGSALAIQQQNQQAQENITSGQEQEVNALQAQVQRAERQAEQDRILQRHGIDTQAATSRYGTDIGAATQRHGIDVGAESGEKVARIGTGGAQEVARIGVGGAQEVAKIGAGSDLAVQGLRGTQEHNLATTNIAAAKDAASQERTHQMKIAKMDESLKNRGMNLQVQLTQAGIKAGEIESKINIAATYVSAIPALKDAGFSKGQIDDVFRAMNLGMTKEDTNNFIGVMNPGPNPQPLIYG